MHDLIDLFSDVNNFELFKGNYNNKEQQRIKSFVFPKNQIQTAFTKADTVWKKYYQEKNEGERRLVNYMDTLIYALQVIWEINFTPNKILWLRLVLKKSEASVGTMELTLFYIMRFKKFFNHMKDPNTKHFHTNLPSLTSSSNETTTCYKKNDLSWHDKNYCPGALVKKNPLSLHPHIAFVSALRLACKFLHDVYYGSGKRWAQITGFSAKELNMYEWFFFKMLDYNITVDMETFINWSKFLHDNICAISEET
nr:5587_t:CDS:2 [Entrophospora candida]